MIEPRTDRDRQYWERHASRYDLSLGPLGKPLPRMLELVAEAAKGRARVLEVAAGTGLVRLVCDRDRDLDHEQQAAVNRARMMPWRR